MPKKVVVLLIAHQGYQPVEYGMTHDVLTSANVNVVTASDQPGVATATDGSTTPVDITLNQINPVEYNGLFIIGGQGTLTCLDNSIVHTLLQQMLALKKPYGAICIAPRILAKAEVLARKKATGWNKDNELDNIFKHHDVTYIRQPVVTDGQVVTATGPSDAGDFAQAILKVLGIVR
jgi:protein deglycase